MAINVENIEKVAELLQKENFVKKFAECDDTNAAIALFAQNGANVTAEDLKAIGTLLKAAQDNDGEIPDEIAEQVAGGVTFASVFTTSFKGIAALGNLFSSLEKPLMEVLKLFGVDIEAEVAKTQQNQN